MESIIVEGGRPLEGKVSISGAKNSVLPLLAAAILFRGGCLLHNCPRLSDVAAAAEFWSIWVAGWTAPGTAFG